MEEMLPAGVEALRLVDVVGPEQAAEIEAFLADPSIGITGLKRPNRQRLIILTDEQDAAIKADIADRIDLRGTVQGKTDDAPYCVGNCADVPVGVEVHDPRCSEYRRPVVRTEVMIHRLEIEPHPNADALELAVVGGYKAVVPKGVYRTGDYALYIPEASVLPRDLVEELGLVGRLSGTGKNRVKAVKLRGELSQGIVCRPDALGFSAVLWANGDLLETLRDEDGSPAGFAEELGIEKWVPHVPTALSGKIKNRGVSRIVPWIEIPNIKKVMHAFSTNELVTATEKIHGTHCMITFDYTTQELLVASKGIGKMGWDLVEEEGNAYWRAVRAHGVDAFMQFSAGFLHVESIDRIALYGEVYGKGIQDLTYGEETPQFAAFDLRIVYKDGTSVWMSHDRFQVLILEAADNGFRIEPAPVVYDGYYDYATLCRLAEEASTVSRVPGDLREGLVIRPVFERTNGDGSRVIAKMINPNYLLRSDRNATEFE